MPKVLVTYYSVTGNTRKMAEMIVSRLREEGVDVVSKEISEVQVAELPGYDGYIIGSPTYYGGMAYQVKQLLDESVKFHGKLEGKVGAAFSSSANLAGGNETTILDILNALLIHGMIIQGDARGDHYGPVAVGSPDERTQKQCERLAVRVAGLLKKVL